MENGMEIIIKLKLWGHSQFQTEINSSLSSMPMIPIAEPISPFNRRNPAPNNVKSQLKSRMFSATTTELPMILQMIFLQQRFLSPAKIQHPHGFLRMEDTPEIMITLQHSRPTQFQTEINTSPSSMPMIPIAEPISPFSRRNPALFLVISI